MKNPLLIVYGESAPNEVLELIKELKSNSNIPFDSAYIKLGIGFLMIKANEIVQDKKSKISLKVLVSESFGEAAIYKYNCCNGIL